MTTKKVPQIRFKGFSGEWEEKRLEEVTKIIMGQSPEGIYYTNNPKDYILVQGNADIKNGIVVPRIWTTKITKMANIGDIIFSVRAPVGDVGKTHYNIVIGRGVASIKGNEFIFQLLKKMNENNFWKKLSAGSTFESINSSDLLAVSIFTTKLNEQTKIGNYFQNLDKLIEQKEKKHKKLGQLKKAMLEKMFPKDDEDTPEIRFKGFSGEWEERSLGEISEYKNGKGHEDKQRVFGKYELINLNSISIDGGLKHSGKYIDETNITLNKNDLVMILSDVGHGDLLGRVALIPEDNKFVLNQRVALLRPQENIISLFLFYNINAHQKYFKLQGAGMSQLNISRSNVENFSLYLPLNIQEQIKIGNYFQKLDKLIDLQLQELEKLKNIKKASLDKMFV